MINEEIIEHNTHIPAHLETTFFLTFQSHKAYLKRYMKTAAQLHNKFWMYLADNVNDLAKLAEIGTKVNKSVELVAKYWQEIAKYKLTSHQLKRFYASFLLQILNDTEASNALLKTIHESAIDLEYSSRLSTYEKNGYGMLTVSILTNPGKINDLNKAACALFGYTKEELKEKNVAALIPQLYSKQHKKTIADLMELVEEKELIGEKHVFGKHRLGYVFAVSKAIRTVPCVRNDWQCVVSVCPGLRKQELPIATVLIDRNLLVKDVSFSKRLNYHVGAMSVLGLSVEMIKEKNIKAAELIPPIVNEDYIKNNLLSDFQSVEFHYPAVREEILEKSTTTLLCMAREIIMEELIGYALMFKEPGALAFETKDKVKPLAMKNRCGIEWTYDPEREVFARVMTDRSIQDLTMRSDILEKEGDNNYKSQLVKNSKRSSNVYRDYSESEEENTKSDESFFARLARRHNKYWNKPDYAKGIVTMRISKTGNFITISRKKLAENQNEIIKEVGTRDYDVVKETSTDEQSSILSGSFKSRKEYVEIIKGKKSIASATYICLYFTLGMTFLAVLSAVEYGLFMAYYKKVAENTEIFSRTLDLGMQLLQGAESTRNLILVNEESYRNYEGYGKEEFAEKTRVELFKVEAAVERIHKELASVTDRLTDLKNEFLIDNKVEIKRIVGSEIQTSTHTLNEAILMYNLRLFQIANDQNPLSEEEENAHFVYTNGLNGIYVEYKLLVDVFNSNMDAYNSRVLKKLMILFIIAMCFVLLGGFVIIPYLCDVKFTKDKILMLFLNIKRSQAKALALRCQRFSDALHKGQSTGESPADESEEETPEDVATLLNTSYTPEILGQGKRKVKKLSTNIVFLSIWGTVNMAFMSTYFIVGYLVFGKHLLKANDYVNASLKNIAQVSTGYYIYYLAVRESILGSTWTFEGLTPLDYSEEMLNKTTNLQAYISSHFELNHYETKLYYSNFPEYLSQFFKESVCEPGRNDYYENAEACSDFAFGAGNEVILEVTR